MGLQLKITNKYDLLGREIICIKKQPSEIKQFIVDNTLLKLLTIIAIVCFCIFSVPQYLHNLPPRTPRFFYNTITQHPYCAGYTDEDDGDSLECDGYWAGGQQDTAWRKSYLWKTKTTGRLCPGCVEYLMDNTPTLWFNLVDEDGAGENVWCELEIDSGHKFVSPIIRYRSQKLATQSGSSVDWEYTVGQEAYCEGDNCGFYDSGNPSTTPVHSSALVIFSIIGGMQRQQF